MSIAVGGPKMLLWYLTSDFRALALSGSLRCTMLPRLALQMHTAYPKRPQDLPIIFMPELSCRGRSRCRRR